MYLILGLITFTLSIAHILQLQFHRLKEGIYLHRLSLLLFVLSMKPVTSYATCTAPNRNVDYDSIGNLLVE